MFEECTNLNYVNVGFTKWNSNENEVSTYDWLANVLSTGTFVCPEDLPIKRGDSYIPVGWDVETY
jgi:hypothetical protein